MNHLAEEYRELIVVSLFVSLFVQYSVLSGTKKRPTMFFKTNHRLITVKVFQNDRMGHSAIPKDHLATSLAFIRLPFVVRIFVCLMRPLKKKTKIVFTRPIFA